MVDTYARACNEVLILLKTYLNEKEYDKIPKERIEFYEKNKDISYNYRIDSGLPLEKQKISKKANSMIVTIFRDYFATQNQKEKLKSLLEQNDKKREAAIRKEYDPDNIFKNREQEPEEKKIEETALVEYKEQSFIQKILIIITNLFKKSSK